MDSGRVNGYALLRRILVARVLAGGYSSQLCLDPGRRRSSPRETLRKILYPKSENDPGETRIHPVRQTGGRASERDNLWFLDLCRHSPGFLPCLCHRPPEFAAEV